MYQDAKERFRGEISSMGEFYSLSLKDECKNSKPPQKLYMLFKNSIYDIKQNILKFPKNF